MIEKMTRYSFILLNSDKGKFLENLQDIGVMDINHSQKPVDSHSEELLSQINALKKLVACIEKGSDETLEKLKAQESECRKKLEEVRVWGDYDKERLSTFGIHYFVESEKKFDESWAQQYAIQEVLRKDGKIWFVTVGEVSGLPSREIPAPDCTLSEAQGELNAKITELKTYSETLQARKAELPSLKKQMEELSCSLNLYLTSLKGENAADDSLIVFEGFAPESLNAELEEKLNSMDCIWASAPATGKDLPPVKLRNNWFARQFEVLTGMYGMPVYDEFDPTPILAPFFLLFFALCMGDAGYGLLLIAIGFILHNKQGGLAKLWRLIICLGFGTTVVGLLMGTFMGINLAKVSWYPQALKNLIISGTAELMGNTIDIKMVMSVCIGIFHICLAMCVKAILYTRRFGFKNNLNTWGWTFLIVGGVITAVLLLMGVFAADIAKWLIIGIGAVSVLGIFIFNKPGRNPLINVGAGLWDTYGMTTGLLGDVLSYIRLYALGLAGGILGETFNNLGQMILGDNPSWHWVPFVLIVIFGHALNLAMSCLGAFVHPLRLTFVEYFKNSGYEGAGRAYSPLNKTTN